MYIDLFLDWSNDNKIRLYLFKQIAIQSINSNKILSQAIKLMPIDKVVNDVSILCKDELVLGNQSEHSIRHELNKLVKIYRKNCSRTANRKKAKSKVDKNPSRTKNILITACGIRKRDELNARYRCQRRKKKEESTAPSYIPKSPKNHNEGITSLEQMALVCLSHGGHNLNDYDWGIENITDNERLLRQDKYRNWCSRLRTRRKKRKPLNIVNIRQFNLTDRIQRTAIIAISKFEHAMRNVTTCVCRSCMEWKMLDSHVSKFVCADCRKNRHNKKYFLQNNLQPIWFDNNGTVQWHVPSELNELSLQEELLIQKSAPYIPVIHLYNGSLGLKGHCVVFERESNGDICKLPRTKSDTVCFNRQYGTKESGKDQRQMPLVVRRKKVMDALHVLKTIHKCYDDIFIGEMPKNETDGKHLKLDQSIRDSDRSINQSHCHDAPTSEITYSAVAVAPPIIPRDDSKVSFVNKLKQCAKDKKVKIPILDFPPTKEEPLRYVEYKILLNTINLVDS